MAVGRLKTTVNTGNLDWNETAARANRVQLLQRFHVLFYTSLYITRRFSIRQPLTVWHTVPVGEHDCMYYGRAITERVEGGGGRKSEAQNLRVQIAQLTEVRCNTNALVSAVAKSCASTFDMSQYYEYVIIQAVRGLGGQDSLTTREFRILTHSTASSEAARSHIHYIGISMR